MPYIRTKGPTYGCCNICGLQSKLTEDHVPPKGTIRFPRMTLYDIGEILHVKAEKSRKGRNFQQGVKFRSICKACNGDYLGGLYDPELIRFANSISRYLHSLVAVPESSRFSAEPGKILRAVLGHILAIGVERFPRGEMGDFMAELVLNPDMEIPDNLAVYYWVYPFWDQVAIRNFSFLVRFGTSPLVGAVLKFFPLGFLVLWNPEPGLSTSLYKLNDFCIAAGNSVVDIPIRIAGVPPQRFPEAPSDTGITLHGADSYFAGRTTRKRYP